MTTMIVAAPAQLTHPSVPIHLLGLEGQTMDSAPRRRLCHSSADSVNIQTVNHLADPHDGGVSTTGDVLGSVEAAIESLQQELLLAAAHHGHWMDRFDMTGGVLADANSLAAFVRTAPNSFLRGLCAGLLMAQMTSSDHRLQQTT